MDWPSDSICSNAHSSLAKKARLAAVLAPRAPGRAVKNHERDLQILIGSYATAWMPRIPLDEAPSFAVIGDLP
jgi:hypothetical protein